MKHATEMPRNPVPESASLEPLRTGPVPAQPPRFGLPLALLFALLFGMTALSGCDRRKPLEGELDTGKPPIIEISADREIVSVVKDTFLTVKALLVNSNHGTLARKRIDFQARIGFITTHDSTNDSGMVSVYYFTSLKNLAGPADDTVIASFAYDGGDGKDRVADTLVLRLVPGLQAAVDSVGSLELASSRKAVQVKGTGNNDQAVISARVFDIYGNPAKDGTPVAFRLLKGPGGGETLGAGLADTSSTKNGAASVSFRSGTRIGVVEIEAASQGHTVRQALLTVTSGPPARLNLMARPDSTVTAGNRWVMEVQAVLTDAYLNPVKDSIGVLFTLDPRQSDPAGVAIEGSAFTGNYRCGDSARVDCLPVAGSAFTRVSYRSDLIFDSLLVTAETSTGSNPVSGALVFQAPLQRPVVRANYYGGAAFAPFFDPVDTLTIFGTMANGLGFTVPGARLCIATDGGRVLDTCQVTDASGKSAFRMTVTARDQTTAASSRVINVFLVEQSTGAVGTTSFLAIFN